MARIAFLLPNLSAGGAERVALTLIEDFVSRGHEIDLVLMAQEGELIGLLPAQVQIFDLGAPRTRYVLRPLIRYLKTRRPQSLLAFMWPLTIIAILAKRLSGVPGRVVTSDHSTLSEHYKSPFTRLSMRLTTRAFYRLADFRIVVSRGVADDLASLSGLPVAAFQVIYNPIPRPPSASDGLPAPAWGIETGRILTVGSLKPEKNHQLLIRSFARLLHHRKARLIILGEGPCRSALEALVRDLGIADHVSMPGYAANPWPYYASSDIFVLSSEYEGFGNVLVEAMRCGIPVVSTDCRSGPREILDDGRYGELVPCGSEIALAEAMIRALDTGIDRAAQRARAEELSGAGAFIRYTEILTGGN